MIANFLFVALKLFVPRQIFSFVLDSVFVLLVTFWV